MIAVAALLMAAEAVVPAGPGRVAPVLGQPYRYILEEQREVGGRLRRFTAERRIVFRREEAGLVAEVTLVRLVQDAGGSVGERFERGAGALRGRTVRLRLSDDGRVVSVEDQAAVWAAIVAGLGSMMRGAGSPAMATVRDSTAAMAGLPAEQQTRVIGSAVAGLLAAPVDLPAPGNRPVTLPATPVPGHGPAAAPLTGTSTADQLPDGMLRIVTRASAPDEAIRLERTRIVDPVTGMLREEQEIRTIRIGGRASTIKNIRRLTPWYSSTRQQSRALP